MADADISKSSKNLKSDDKKSLLDNSLKLLSYENFILHLKTDKKNIGCKINNYSVYVNLH